MQLYKYVAGANYLTSYSHFPNYWLPFVLVNQEWPPPTKLYTQRQGLWRVVGSWGSCVHCWIHLPVSSATESAVGRWGLVRMGGSPGSHLEGCISLLGSSLLSASWVPWYEHLSSTTPSFLVGFYFGGSWAWTEIAEIESKWAPPLLNCGWWVFCPTKESDWRNIVTTCYDLRFIP